jgi:hypothetical protein
VEDGTGETDRIGSRREGEGEAHPGVSGGHGSQRTEGMMQGFEDMGGDTVNASRAGAAYVIACLSDDGEGGFCYAPTLLDRAMARALAADLIAFADSAERETT